MTRRRSISPRHEDQSAVSAYSIRSTVLVMVAALLSLFAFAPIAPAHAFSIELKGVAPDRIERQRAAIRNALPLPNTPDLNRLDDRLAAKGLKRGNAVFIRIFKQSSELELWMAKDGRFVHFATYPMCQWDGSLGPKVREGDRQSPEGFYTVTKRQMWGSRRWPKQLNLGFPNAYDRAHKRTGSYLLIHGGCTSIGCFALTNPVINEVHGLARAALRAGQPRLHVHVLPFRMTAANLERERWSLWAPFWQQLKAVNDTFEATGLPPRVAVCNKRYVGLPSASLRASHAPLSGSCPAPFRDAAPTVTVAQVAPPLPQRSRMIAQRTALAENGDTEQANPTRARPPLPRRSRAIAARSITPNRVATRTQTRPTTGARSRPRSTVVDLTEVARALNRRKARRARRRTPVDRSTRMGLGVASCNPGLASCRKFRAMKKRRRALTRQRRRTLKRRTIRRRSRPARIKRQRSRQRSSAISKPISNVPDFKVRGFQS